MSALTLIQKIEQQINDANLAESFTEQGTIIDIKDGVATVSGLHNAQYSVYSSPGLTTSKEGRISIKTIK